MGGNSNTKSIHINQSNLEEENAKKSMPFSANVVIQMNFDMNEIIIIANIVGICKLQWNLIAIKAILPKQPNVNQNKNQRGIKEEKNVRETDLLSFF